MDLCRLIEVAAGREPADLVIRGGRLVNVLSGAIEEVDLAICAGLIASVGAGYDGREEVDVGGAHLCPGLIDPHMHLESSQVTLPQFARAVVPLGTTAVVLDPHEIANVHGMEGVGYLLQSRRNLPLSVFITAPSCVPATQLETAGAELGSEQIAELLDEPGVVGLGEMMNFPGVLGCDRQVLEKLRKASERKMVRDGHSPGLSGADLNSYLAAGIDSDHECTTAEEAAEKLARGMYLFIREGSSARNLADLLPFVTAQNSRRVSFCTDDREPGDLLEHGHLDDVVRKAVAAGLDPVTAITMASLNAAERFCLDREGYGAIAPGRRADVLVCESLDPFRVRQVYVAGRLVAEDGQISGPIPATADPPAGSMNLGWDRFEGLAVPAEGHQVRVIRVLEGQVITGHDTGDACIRDGMAVADSNRDLLKIAVFERHHASGRVGIGFVRGFGLRQGALASSVAHDSHNIVVVGADDADMLAAVRELERGGGGQVVVCDGQVRAMLELPIAGLMSDKPLEQVHQASEKLVKAARELGCSLPAPFMTLSFLALPVIPSLKLTDMGLVDVDSFSIVPLWVD